jgi:hypothetical protein
MSCGSNGTHYDGGRRSKRAVAPVRRVFERERCHPLNRCIDDDADDETHAECEGYEPARIPHLAGGRQGILKPTEAEDGDQHGTQPDAGIRRYRGNRRGAGQGGDDPA